MNKSIKLQTFRNAIRPWQFAAMLVALATFCLGSLAGAANIIKADNSDALNLGTSWIGGVSPGAADVAQWDSTVSAANTTGTLGTSVAWDGIRILNPGGPVTISADGNTLTNGTFGIDLSQASQSLTLDNNVALGAPQYWQVGNNQTLDLEGALTRSTGSAILFNFDSTPVQVTINTAASGTVVTANNTLLLDGTIGSGTGAGIAIGTVNDVDFAALDSNNHVVPGSSISGLYTANPSGNAPTIGSLSGVYDFSNTNSFGARVSSTFNVDAFRFNTPQPNPASANTFAYNGVGSWDVLFKANNVLDVNAILMTTNLGKSYVVFTPAGTSSTRIADALNELVVYQNNPASSLVWQLPINQRNGNSIVSKLGVGTMEYQAACTYSGGTLIYGGTLLVDGAGTAGSGPISVFNGGNFEGQNGAINYAPVIVSDGGTNSVFVAAANGQFENNTNLTFSAGTTCLQFIYSNTIVPSTTVAPLLVTNGILAASNTVNINVLCGNLSPGQFPLIKYTGTLGGAGFSAFNLAGYQPHISAYLSNNVDNSSIDLVVTSDNQPIHWAGGSGTWDINQTADWLDALGSPTTYQETVGIGDQVLFDDSASGTSPITVTLNASTKPGAVTVNNNSKNYTISGSGDIGGSTSLTKTGTGVLTLLTANDFTAGLNINGGAVIFTALNELGAGTINFNGGALQYASGNVDDISTHTVTFNAGGGTIDDGGNIISYANSIGNNGVGGLTKIGAGTVTLNGTNTYFGNTVVGAGTLALGASTYINNSAAIIVDGGAVLDTSSSGVNLNLSSGANQVLAGAGTVEGNVTAPTGTTISPATNGAYGTLSLANDLTVSGGALAMDISSASHDLITVSGNLTLTSGTLALNVSGTLANGAYKLISYGGSLSSGNGSSANLTVIGFSQPGQAATLSDATAGEIDLIVSASASDGVIWSGTGTSWDTAGTTDWLLNGVTTWAYTNGDIVTFNDTASGALTVELQTALLPSSATVSNNTTSYTFADGTGTGGGKISGPTSLVKDGNGTLILQTANTYTGSTVVKNGTIQVGNGSSGDIGLGDVTDNGALVFNQGDGNVHAVAGQISGTGSLTQQGSATLVLAKNNSYSGPTTISSGTLQVGNGGTTGSLGVNVTTDNGTLTLNRSGSYSFTNSVNGSGALVKVGTATVSISTSLAYQGNTVISNGVMKLAASNLIPNASSVSGSTGWLILDGGVSSAGTFDLNGANETINALSGLAGTFNGTVTDSGASATTTNTLTILGAAATTYGGLIADNPTGAKLMLVLVTNSIELDAANTYGGGTFVGNGATLAVGETGVAGAGGIIVSNGTVAMPSASSTSASIGETITTLPNSTATFTSGELANGIGASFVGSSTSTNIITGPVSISQGSVEQFSNFLGTVLIASGGTARFSSTGLTMNGGKNTTFDIEGTGALQTRNAGTVNLGALTGNGFITTPQANSGTGVFNIGFNNVDSTFSGTISGTNSIVKVGTGTLTLDGSTNNFSIVVNDDGSITTNYIATNGLSYFGATTISNGVLAIVAPANLNGDSFTTFTLAGDTATLDLSSAGYTPDGVTMVTNSTLILGADGTPQTINGFGTIKGSLIISNSATISAGLPTGVLSITGSVELGGIVNMNLNATNVPNSSEISSPVITVDGTATLIVTNLGGDIVNGTTFHLFNQAVSGFSSIVLPATDPTGVSTYTWNNNLASDGTIQLISGGASPINTNPTNITASVSGSIGNQTLNLSWPADHTGWQLQTQTNSLDVGISTNWVDVPGAELTNQVAIPINPTNGTVFFRMVITNN